MSKYPTANITLASLEDKGLTMKLKDSNGKYWIVWKNEYQTQQPSEAYEALMNYKIGDTFGVTYGEKEEEYQGKSYTKRTIYGIMPPVANPTVPTKSNPLYSKPVSDPEPRNYAKEGYEKCLWNYWLEMTVAGHELKLNWQDDVWNVFKDIEVDAKKRFFEFSPESEPLPEELPIVDVNQDLGEDIPF